MLKVQGKENLTQYKTNNRPFIICANHLSAIDPAFIVFAWGAGKQLRIMAKKELFENPVLSWILYKLGAFPVDRGKGDKSALEKGIHDIKSGRGMIIFPEGRRGKSNKMLKMKSGALLIAEQTNADIVPVRLIYPNKKSGARLFGKVVVKIGEPIPAESLNLQSGSRKALREAKNLLQERLDELFFRYNEQIGNILPYEMPESEN
jgi:1-acyl-sn-glycerol-3-phosphate acyltransferase